MKLNVFRCREGYLLAEMSADYEEAAARHGPLDFVGEFQMARLSPDVHARVAGEISERGFALIQRYELVFV